MPARLWALLKLISMKHYSKYYGALGPFEVNFNERLRKYYGAVGPFEVKFDETLRK